MKIKLLKAALHSKNFDNLRTQGKFGFAFGAGLTQTRNQSISSNALDGSSGQAKEETLCRKKISNLTPR